MIVGAGINGLLLARELAETGAEIVIVDKNKAGSESSWAGGGIVSPLYPWRYSTPVTDLASWSQQVYPQLIAELFEETGIDPEYVVSGLLMLAAADEKAALSWAQAQRRNMEKVDSSFIYSKEPRLASEFSSALWMSDVANVRNPRLCRALKKSLLLKNNVNLLEQCELVALEKDEVQISTVRIRQLDSSREERIKANNYIFSSGAWTHDLLKSAGVTINVKPVKGQMLLYKFEKLPLSTILLTQSRYLIPRKDGHVLAGSTMEYSGYDKSTTKEAKEELRNSVVKLLPELANEEPIRQWAGLRPGTEDGMPYIGQVPPLRKPVC